MERDVVLIKATHPEQGAFVRINKEDFDPTKGHELYVMPAPPAGDTAPPAPAAGAVPVDPLASLPANWQEKPLHELQPIVQAACGRTADDHAQAIAMIDEALKAKATAAAQ